MNATYRMLVYVPDPFSFARVPVAASIRVGDELVRILAAPHLPGPACVGGLRSVRFVQEVVRELEGWRPGDATPNLRPGPAVFETEPVDIPADVKDPIAWVRDHVLASQVDPRSSAKTTAGRGDSRASRGYAFFKARGVAHLVRKTFRAERVAPGRFPAAVGLAPISHFVMGPERLLLMEPIAVPCRDVERDAAAVHQRFASYHAARGETDADVALVAYIHGRAPDRVLQAAHDGVAHWADAVHHTADRSSAEALVDRVVDVSGPARLVVADA